MIRPQLLFEALPGIPWRSWADLYVLDVKSLKALSKEIISTDCDSVHTAFQLYIATFVNFHIGAEGAEVSKQIPSAGTQTCAFHMVITRIAMSDIRLYISLQDCSL